MPRGSWRLPPSGAALRLLAGIEVLLSDALRVDMSGRPSMSLLSEPALATLWELLPYLRVGFQFGIPILLWIRCGVPNAAYLWVITMVVYLVCCVVRDFFKFSNAEKCLLVPSAVVAPIGLSVIAAELVH